MGFFSRLQSEAFSWPGQQLEAQNQVDAIISNSFLRPQLIFKHSTRCSISRFVLSDFISNYGFSEQEFGAWYLDLLAYRSISNAVAVQFNVEHQSPQLLVIKNGKVIAHASHEAISTILLSEFLM